MMFGQFQFSNVSAAKVPIMITFDVAGRYEDPNDIKPQTCIFKSYIYVESSFKKQKRVSRRFPFDSRGVKRELQILFVRLLENLAWRQKLMILVTFTMNHLLRKYLRASLFIYQEAWCLPCRIFY